jgi:hypothetical protein
MPGVRLGLGFGAGTLGALASGDEWLASCTPAIWDVGAVERRDNPRAVVCLARRCGVVMNGGWNATRALAHVGRIPGEGIALCNGTFPDDVKCTITSLREDFIQRRGRLLSNRAASDERVAVLREETAARVENRSIYASASRGSGSHDVPVSGSIMASFAVANSSNLSSAISDMVFGDGLPFCFVNSPRFQRVLEMAKKAPAAYKAPDRHALSDMYLPESHATRVRDTEVTIRRYLPTFGASVISDGATIMGNPLLNVLIGTPLGFFLEKLVDCTDALAKGASKDAHFLTHEVSPVFKKYGEKHMDLVIFDGAEMSAGDMLVVRYPHTSAIRCGMHVVGTSFFGKIAKIDFYAKLIEANTIMFDWFGNVRHSQHAMFKTQSKAFNHGTYVALAKGADQRMASMFVGLHKLCRNKPTLEATITTAAYVSKDFGADDRAKPIIKDPYFWRRVLAGLRVVYPAMRLMRLGDESRPCMGYVCYWTNMTTEAITRARDDENTFEVLGVDTLDEVESLWRAVVPELLTDYALVADLLNPAMAVLRRENGAVSTYAQREAAERVIDKLYYDDDDVDSKKSQFMSTLHDFEAGTGKFDKTYIWNDPKATSDHQLHEWFDQYATPIDDVFGYVGCKVLSKAVGIGAGERSWGELRDLWTKARNAMDSEKAEMALYCHAALRYAERATDTDNPPLTVLWPKKEAEHDLGLSKWGVVIDEAAENLRPFNNFMEKWEPAAIKDRKKISEFKLLEKYGGVVFFDLEEVTDDFEGLYKISSKNCEYVKRSKGVESGWRVVARPLSAPDDDEDSDEGRDEDREEEWVSYTINDTLHEMFRAVDDQSAYGATLVTEDAALDSDDDADDDDVPGLEEKPGDDDDDAPGLEDKPGDDDDDAPGLEDKPGDDDDEAPATAPGKRGAPTTAFDSDDDDDDDDGGFEAEIVRRGNKTTPRRGANAKKKTTTTRRGQRN